MTKTVKKVVFSYKKQDNIFGFLPLLVSYTQLHKLRMHRRVNNGQRHNLPAKMTKKMHTTLGMIPTHLVGILNTLLWLLLEDLTFV